MQTAARVNMATVCESQKDLMMEYTIPFNTGPTGTATTDIDQPSLELQLVQEAMLYASLGWHVVPVKPNGKIPIAGKAWQEKATCDEEQIAAWWERTPDANVGVKLGEDSGIVDFEGDGPGAEKAISMLFGGDVPVTPTYKSSRGKHRIFKYRDDLPAPDKNSFHIGDLEIRTGNGGKGAQSVFPVSIHKSGVQYEWLISPSECESAEITDEVLARLWNLLGEDINAISPPKSKSKSARLKFYEQNVIPEGERDDAIYAESCAMWREQYERLGQSAFDSTECQTIVYRRLWAWNKAILDPPYDDDYVQKKCEGGRVFIRNQVAAGDHSPKEVKEIKRLTSWGLEYKENQFWPGHWRVEAVNSDPPVIRLFAPFLLEDGYVDLSAEEYNSPTKVHLAVLAATRKICLDDGVLPWSGIWKGNAKKRERGLRAKLLDDALHVEAAPEVKKTIIIAEKVYDVVIRARVVEKGATPPTHKPYRDHEGGFYFSFTGVWSSMNDGSDKITRADLSNFLGQLDAGERRASGTGARTRLKYLSRDQVRGLEEMATGKVETVSRHPAQK